MRRLTKLLTYLLVTAQLLLVVPAVASTHVSTSASAPSACDGMPMHNGDDPCPCCPDGSKSMTGCLASCLLTAVAAPTIFVVQVVSISDAAFVEPPFTANAFSDPPLKPPPIA